MAMFTFPFASYFGTHYILRDMFGVDGFVNVVWSVIASVAAVNLIIALYAYKAYHEPDEDSDQPPPLPPRMKRSDLNLKQD
ncbi:putative 28S rRNA (cytosine-C(5))-methyltransferase [Homalodisca vitripennis]|nr:putative 28S rRNA (cytosine-C(5))-methyltransferase [Homalodisca vitripennis]